MNDDPFLVLGLPREASLSDDDVRAAWRRIAAATHPDRDDGGDPARFGAAAAAYATLRTAYGRGEALADAADAAANEGGVRGRRGGGTADAVRGRHRRAADAGRRRRGRRDGRGPRDGRRARDRRGRGDGRGVREARDGRGRQGRRDERAARDRNGRGDERAAREARDGRGRQGRRDGRGRPGRLALRTAGAVAVSAVAIAVAGWAPASIGVLAGVLTWLVATGRHDLPPRERG